MGSDFSNNEQSGRILEPDAGFKTDGRFIGGCGLIGVAP